MMGHVYGALLVAGLVLRRVCAESVRWLAGCMGFVWVRAVLFLPGVSSPFSLFCIYCSVHRTTRHAANAASSGVTCLRSCPAVRS